MRVEKGVPKGKKNNDGYDRYEHDYQHGHGHEDGQGHHKHQHYQDGSLDGVDGNGKCINGRSGHGRPGSSGGLPDEELASGEDDDEDDHICSSSLPPVSLAKQSRPLSRGCSFHDVVRRGTFAAKRCGGYMIASDGSS